MQVLAWLFVGLIGAGATFVSITTTDDQVAIISGLIGVFAWILFAYIALSVTTYDQAGTLHTDRYPAMTAFGLLMAMPNLFVALTGPLEIVRNRDELRSEVQ